MKIYIVQLNYQVQPQAFTSLKDACKQAQVSYSTARTGKRQWIKNGSIIAITEAQLITFKRNRKHTSNQLEV